MDPRQSISRTPSANIQQAQYPTNMATTYAIPYQPHLPPIHPHHHHQQQQDDRVRLGLHFNHEGSSISPSAYRTYSDYPRSSYAPQMPAPATAGQLSRSGVLEEEESPSTTVRVAVSLPTLEQFKDCGAPFSVSRAAGLGLDGHDHRRFCDEEVHKRWWVNPSQPSGELNFFPELLMRTGH